MWPVQMGIFHQRKFRGCGFDYFSLIRLRDKRERKVIMLVYIPMKFNDYSLFYRCATRFFRLLLLTIYFLLVLGISS